MDLAVASTTCESGKHQFIPSLHVSRPDPTANMGLVRGDMNTCSRGQPQAAVSLRWLLAGPRLGQKGVPSLGIEK